ncbi:hypothetical protein DFJ74DRAFT_692039 [Hyaloraphidium curvatum]|nr:hypothetical protein DFJ74DRAFT_692039 [Hyaloraphidium curvatum]
MGSFLSTSPVASAVEGDSGSPDQAVAQTPGGADVAVAPAEEARNVAIWKDLDRDGLMLAVSELLRDISTTYFRYLDATASPTPGLSAPPPYAVVSVLDLMWLVDGFCNDDEPKGLAGARFGERFRPRLFPRGRVPTLGAPTATQADLALGVFRIAYPALRKTIAVFVDWDRDASWSGSVPGSGETFAKAFGEAAFLPMFTLESLARASRVVRARLGDDPELLVAAMMASVSSLGAELDAFETARQLPFRAGANLLLHALQENGRPLASLLFGSEKPAVRRGLSPFDVAGRFFRESALFFHDPGKGNDPVVQNSPLYLLDLIMRLLVAEAHRGISSAFLERLRADHGAGEARRALGGAGRSRSWISRTIRATPAGLREG